MLRKLLPHVTIVLALMYLIFYAIDRVNPVMAFIDNEITKALLVALALAAIIQAILLVHDDRARERKRLQRQARGSRKPTRQSRANP